MKLFNKSISLSKIGPFGLSIIVVIILFNVTTSMATMLSRDLANYRFSNRQAVANFAVKSTATSTPPKGVRYAKLSLNEFGAETANKYDHRYRRRTKVPFDAVDDQRKGLLTLNRLLIQTFIEPTFRNTEQLRSGKRRAFSEIPTVVGRVIRGLTNFTVTIGRTINSENVNGSLSRLITSRLVGVSESLMGWVERSVDDLPSIPRLDAQECMKRCICEAHNQPKKYGAVGLVIQLFFPPYLDSEDATKIVSKYQLAARYGRGENANCAAQYDGCMVNVLDVLQGAINMVF